MNISLGADETLHVELKARNLDTLSKSFGLEAENCLYLGNELILFALRHQWQRKVTTLPPTFMSKLTRNMLQLHQYQDLAIRQIHCINISQRILRGCIVNFLSYRT